MSYLVFTFSFFSLLPHLPFFTLFSPSSNQFYVFFSYVICVYLSFLSSQPLPSSFPSLPPLHLPPPSNLFFPCFFFICLYRPFFFISSPPLSFPPFFPPVHLPSSPNLFSHFYFYNFPLPSFLSLPLKNLVACSQCHLLAHFLTICLQ